MHDAVPDGVISNLEMSIAVLENRLRSNMDMPSIPSGVLLSLKQAKHEIIRLREQSEE